VNSRQKRATSQLRASYALVNRTGAAGICRLDHGRIATDCVMSTPSVEDGGGVCDGE
jgi:hypothetical protein